MEIGKPISPTLALTNSQPTLRDCLNSLLDYSIEYKLGNLVWYYIPVNVETTIWRNLGRSIELMPKNSFL